MGDSTIERVAQALFNHWRHPSQRSWEWGRDVPDHVTAYWREGAHAAIKAIEPTPEMILAGLHTTDMLNVEDIDGEALAAAFKAMMRTAIAERIAKDEEG